MEGTDWGLSLEQESCLSFENTEPALVICSIQSSYYTSERTNRCGITEQNALELPPVSFLAKHVLKQNCILAIFGQAIPVTQAFCYKQHILPWMV